jgi:hypothetical protein
MSQDEVFAAQMDTLTNSVKLPKGADHSSLSLLGLSMADIELKHYGGGIRGMLDDETHTKERAIDGDAQSFWAEVILTDEPIRQQYDGETYFGAICEVIINLFRADLVNHIHLDPFSNYPLGIVKIYYCREDNESWVDLGIEPISSTTMMEFNFSEVLAKRIKIVLNQRNPSQNSYNIPKRVISNATMWQQIVDREYSISTETEVPIQATQDMIDYVTGWRAYVDETRAYAERLKEVAKSLSGSEDTQNSEKIFDATTKEISKATTSKMTDPLKLSLYGKSSDYKDELIEVRKYEYVYGAYEIAVKKVWYMDHGEYISPMYSPNGTVIEAKLDVTDVVPSGTSIEYQLSTRPGEWRNILPSGGMIFNERLKIDSNTLTGNLRFPSTTPPSGIRRNSIDIPSADYQYDPSDASITIDQGWYTGTSSYLVDYLPDGVRDVVPSGVVVNFSEDVLLDAIEVFNGSVSRQYKIDLGHFPFVNYSIINDTLTGGKASPNFSYEEGRWYNFTGDTVNDILPGEYYDVIQIHVDGYEATNRTNYYDNERPALAAYHEITYPYFDYIHSGKSIYLNAPTYKREVKVKYKYLNDYIQLKAILRNNDKGNVSNTPVIEDITIKMRTI